MGLAGRIENFALTDNAGVNVPVRRGRAIGEYEAEREATRFRYDVRLDPPNDAGSAAQTSWLAGEHGLLMLTDLFPRGTGNVRVHFSLPDGWNIASAENRLASGEYQIEDAERAVFLVGRNLRERQARVERMDFTFAFAGEWPFTEDEAMQAATDILRAHRETTGTVPAQRAAVLLAPFPASLSARRWSAETRGATVTFLSGRYASRTAAMGALSVALAHELFHLWLPNSLALNGSYDWFYEGFTLHEAGLVSVRLGYLTFQDLLDGVARAFDSYQAVQSRRNVSLIEASRQRWSGANDIVYNKGLLAAFLYDLELRRETRRRQSLSNVYRELFVRHRTGAERADANRSVLSVLNRTARTGEFTRRFIEGTEPIDLSAALAPYGLQVERFNARTRISVSASLNREQQNLLRDFGYNLPQRRR